MRISALTYDQSRSERANAILSGFGESYRGYGMFAAAYGSAVLDWFAPPLHVAIVGPRSSPKTIALREAATQMAAPPVHVDVIDPQLDRRRLDGFGQSAAEEPVAYVCGQRECFARTTEPRELATALSQSTAASRT